MTRIRRHITYANVISTLCLVIVLGGSASAAVMITGKNIKNNTVTTKDVKNGSLLSADFKAGQVPAGPTGTAGAPGPSGKDLLSQTPLASATTESGVYGANGSSADPMNVGVVRLMAPVQFPQPLPAALDAAHTVIVPYGTSSATHCPGTGNADRGYLCVYETVNVGAFKDGTGIEDPATLENGAGTHGTIVRYTTIEKTSYVFGTWSVTAP